MQRVHEAEDTFFQQGYEHLCLPADYDGHAGSLFDRVYLRP
jgi:hypothetical protein